MGQGYKSLTFLINYAIMHCLENKRLLCSKQRRKKSKEDVPMETPLTASINQGDKLRERIGIALEKSGVPKNLIQVALGHPGTGLEDEFVASIVKYAKKASGIVTPVRAEDSGLIPNGWSVYVRKGVWQD